MKPHAGRIAVLTLIMAGVAGAVVLMPVLSPRHPTASLEFETWIPLPPDGMDARQGAIRELLARNSVYADTETGTLALRCGIDSSEGQPAEHYAIAIGDGALAPNREHWNVDIVPSGDRMEVAIRFVSPYPPPPPPEPGKAEAPAMKIQDRTIHYQADRESMRPIHDALANADLWLAQQGEEPFGCADGRPVLIEACVHGQYVARLRNCDAGSGEPAQKLWDLLRQRFPQTAVGQ